MWTSSAPKQVFQVAVEARELEASGRTVYPFHMGELDFPTPPNIVEACARALRDGKTKYTPNGGLPELREALALDVGRERGVEYSSENVAIQPAGKPVIGKFLLALMDPGDEVLFPNPGFPDLQLAHRVLRRGRGAVPLP